MQIILRVRNYADAYIATDVADAKRKASCTAGDEAAARAWLRKYFPDAKLGAVSKLSYLHLGGIDTSKDKKGVTYWEFDQAPSTQDKAPKAKKAPRKRPAKAVPATVVTLPSLPEIVDRLGATQLRLAKAREEFEKITLADYVWIGVCCLAAQEHHTLTHSERAATGGKAKAALSRVTKQSDDSALAVHSQGFAGWLALAMPTLLRPTAYKYIDAAKGAGFTAYSTEPEVRKGIAAWIKDFQKRHGKALTLAALVEQGKTVDRGAGAPDPEKRVKSIDQIKYEAIQEFTAYAEQLVAAKAHFSPAESEAVTNKLANTLQQITGYEWSPVLK